MKNKKSSKNIVSVVSEALTPVINELGYEVWDIEYVKEGADYFLRFTIDSDDGIDIDDCEKVHRAIDPLLDELDPIEDAYHLEVSSPGLERDLRYDWHYEVCIGEKAELRLFAPIEAYPGKKSFVGILKAYEDGKITLDADGGEVTIPHEAVSKAKTVYDF
ncbi:MAG: ribosome maturation factor RimP [Ruminococcaceae bacterium]|nr:ribosome maturation factor RimP [Oscillospiraceae bacterium]